MKMPVVGSVLIVNDSRRGEWVGIVTHINKDDPDVVTIWHALPVGDDYTRQPGPIRAEGAFARRYGLPVWRWPDVEREVPLEGELAAKREIERRMAEAGSSLLRHLSGKTE